MPYQWSLSAFTPSVRRRLPAIALLALLALAAVAVAACGDDDDSAGGTKTFGSQSFNDHGTQDARGKTTFDLEADSYYFSPTFIRGNPGQKVTLHVKNESSALHNLSAAGGVDTDIPAGKTVDIEVTFPQSGVLLFSCKYHAGQGMAGELLAGNASPGPAVASSPATATASAEGQSANSYYSY